MPGIHPGSVGTQSPGITSFGRYDVKFTVGLKKHVTFGFTYKFTNGSELDFALTHAFSNSIRGLNPLINYYGNDMQPGGGDDISPQYIELTMDQWEVGIGYTWKF